MKKRKKKKKKKKVNKVNEDLKLNESDDESVDESK